MVQTGFPIFSENSPTVICDQIMWLVKHSNLNFNVQETPFSLNICLKKCFINKWPSRVNDQAGIFSEQAQKVETEKEKQINILEKTVKGLNDQIVTLTRKGEDNEKSKVKSEHEEKRLLQVKHEKICAENKALKNDYEEFRKELNISSVALKASKKDSKDISHRLDKKVESLEEKIRCLNEYKIAKESEEKDLRAKIKKADKKQKHIQEKEAKLELEKIALQKSQMKIFQSPPLHSLSTNLDQKNDLLPKNHDTQNNLEPDTAQSLSSTTTFPKDAPKVQCDMIGEVFDVCESKEELFASFIEHFKLGTS